MFQSRAWQKKSFKTVDELTAALAARMNPVVVPVNACVGSGKTVVACYAFGKYISENRNAKTVQMFVTPRIRLCDQQNAEIRKFLADEFGLVDKKDYEIIPVDCTKHCWSRNNDNLVANHAVFVVCDESLWGSSEGPDPAARWHGWLHRFKAYAEQGFTLGWIALDESHNYEKNERLMLSEDGPCLADFFRLMPMSGTPAAFQKEWSEKWKKNVCSCPPKTAMDNGWICRPRLNLVVGDSETQWARAVAAVLNREKAKCAGEAFRPRLMVNCSGIDDVKRLVDLPWFRERAGKEFHMVTLHSKKGYSDDGILKFAEPTIDCATVEPDRAYEAIEHIDDNGFFKDDLPIIVAQVQMLGEGINVSSFNSILTASNSHKTAMQQIGRCVRNYRIGDADKVRNGHANVYVMTDNLASVKNLLVNLNEYDLTDECFSWGDRIDIPTGSGPEIPDDAEAPELNGAAWEAIDPDHDIEIVDLTEAVDKKLYRQKESALVASLLAGDGDRDGVSDLAELEELLKLPAVAGKVKLWGLKGGGGGASAKKTAGTAERPATQAAEKPDGGEKPKSARASLAVEVVMSCLRKIKAIRRGSDFMRRLWNADRRKCVAATLQSDEIAAFLTKHIPADRLDKVTK